MKSPPSLRASLVVAVLGAFLVPAAPCSASLILKLGGEELTRSGRSIANDAMTLKFEDIVDGVQMSVSFNGGSGVDAGAFVNDLVFNIDDSKTVTDFIFIASLSSVEAKSIVYSKNDTSLPPEHGFDVKFAFSNSNKDSGAARFNVGETTVYNLLGSGITSSSFNFTNPTGSHAYTHVNSYESGNSGKFSDVTSVPEPASGLIWLTAIGLVALVRNRK